jgi:4-amino-4-deoxy-L-arabinose transferase-like glycosyltransferase
MPEKLRRLAGSVWFITLVAFAIRMVVVAFLYQGQMNPRRDHFPFGYETGRIARAIASGRGFSDPLSIQTGATAWMAPLYPYVVAGMFKIFGIYTVGSAIALLTLNSLFSAFTCLPVFLIGRDSFGSRTGTSAAWAWALFPYSILLSADMIWETCLTTLLLTSLFLIALRLEHSTRLKAWAGFGLLGGIAALTNPAVLSLVPLFAGWACIRLHRRGEKWALPAAVAAVVLILVLLPWEARNYRTFHELVPLRDNLWMNVWLTNHGDTSLFTPETSLPSTNDAEAQEFSRVGELGYMAEKRLQAIDFIRSHPGWFVWMTFRRFLYTWTGAWSLPRSPVAIMHFDPDEPFDPANVAFCTGLSMLAILGLRRAFVKGAETRWLYALLLASFPLLYYFSISQMRYRHPIDPEILVLAVYTCVSSFRSKYKVTVHSPGIEPGNVGLQTRA